jgi:DNA-binding response OmpR family regulator
MEPEKQKINLDHALLMEDDEACQKIMHYHLRQLKYQVDLTNDGSRAIQFIENFTYDLIIVDIRLYGTSCKDVIQFVRDSELNTDTLLIVWSAFVNKNDEEKYLAWGADAALIKWCTDKLLENTIQKCLKRKLRK